MRDLFRFLYRARNTLLVAALMVASLLLLYNGSMHHRALALSSSNAWVATIYGWRTEITDYAGLKEVNRRLAEENSNWRNRHVSTYAPVESHFAEINDTLHRQRFSYMPAKVVNSTWHKQMNFLTLDKGASAGVTSDMGVIGMEGIVGVVRSVSTHYASVKSVLSPDLEVSVQLRNSGHFGLLRWDRNRHGPTSADVVDIAKHVRLAPGDTVETRGGDGIFPPGIPVGVVTQVVPDAPGIYIGITIRLIEDMTRSGFVYLVRDLEKEERERLELEQMEP